VIGTGGVALGVAATLYLAPGHRPDATRPDPESAAESPATSPPEPSPVEADAPRHGVPISDASGARCGTALLLQARPGGGTFAFLPLGSLPLRGDLRAADGRSLSADVLAVAEAYGFVLLVGFGAEGLVPLRPRRAPIGGGVELRQAGTSALRRVVGWSPAHPNVVLLEPPCDDGAVLVDGDGDAAALGLRDGSALVVTPAWLWIEAPAPARPLATVQAELRARDPVALLEDAAREVNEATTPEATRRALDRLEIGYALARGQEQVQAYDRALRRGNRVLAQRLAEAGDARGALAHVRLCLVRFPADVDLLADAVVLAAGAGDYQFAGDLWLELRSREPERAGEHGAGLAEALLRAAGERVSKNPREAVELLARGVDLFPERADLRMEYATALLQSGDGPSALWQAQIAAGRDPSLLPRLQAIASRTPASGSSVEIPIDPASHVVRAPCLVAGRSLELMVDTGASITVLPSEFAALGKRTGRRVRIQTASGVVEGELVRFAELRIGGLTIDHVTAAPIDLPGTLAGKGLLGMNVLRRLNLQLDGARDMLVLRR